MSKKKEGWWQVFRKPEKDEAGQWFIQEENTKTGEVTIHLYESEAEADTAYVGMFQAMLNGKRQ
jgi:hypothetical protein